jgi:hypothetical protein
MAEDGIAAGTLPSPAEFVGAKELIGTFRNVGCGITGIECILKQASHPTTQPFVVLYLRIFSGVAGLKFVDPRSGTDPLHFSCSPVWHSPG